MVSKLQQFKQMCSNSCQAWGSDIFDLGALNKTYTVTITNTSATLTGTYVLFGYNIYGDAANAGSTPLTLFPVPSGVSVVIAESSHSEVKRDMAANPFITQVARYRTDSNSNLQLPISYVRDTSTGSDISKVIQPINYLEPENKYISGSSVIRITDFEGLNFDGDNYLTGTIAADSTINFIITLKTKLQLSFALENKNIVINA